MILVSWVIGACAVVALLGWLLARKQINALQTQHRADRVLLDTLQAQHDRAHRDYVELQELHAQKPVNVRDLAPLFCAADPSAPTAGLVRLTYRAHTWFRNQVKVSLQIADVLALDMTHEQRVMQLCDIYSRAIFEVTFRKHFDAAGDDDALTDVLFMKALAEAAGVALAREVHDRTELHGIVLRPFPFDPVPAVAS